MLCPYRDEITAARQCGFDVTDQLLIRLFALSDTGEKIGVQ
jgi:hypothetical protein